MLVGRSTLPNRSRTRRSHAPFVFGEWLDTEWIGKMDPKHGKVLGQEQNWARSMWGVLFCSTPGPHYRILLGGATDRKHLGFETFSLDLYDMESFPMQRKLRKNIDTKKQR